MYLIEPIRNGTWIYDPGIAMALQDYIKNHVFLDDDIMFPHITRPAVQIGKFQNAYEEVNQPYMDKDRKSTRLNSSHVAISYAVFCLKKKNLKAHGQPARRHHARVLSVRHKALRLS